MLKISLRLLLWHSVPPHHHHHQDQEDAPHHFSKTGRVCLHIIMIIIILIMIKSKLLTISLRLLLIASGKVCVHVTTNKSHVSGAPSMYSIPHLRSC